MKYCYIGDLLETRYKQLGWGGVGSILCHKYQYGNICLQKPKENNVPAFTDSRIPQQTEQKPVI